MAISQKEPRDWASVVLSHYNCFAEDLEMSLQIIGRKGKIRDLVVRQRSVYDLIDHAFYSKADYLIRLETAGVFYQQGLRVPRFFCGCDAKTVGVAAVVMGSCSIRESQGAEIVLDQLEAAEDRI